MNSAGKVDSEIKSKCKNIKEEFEKRGFETSASDISKALEHIEDDPKSSHVKLRIVLEFFLKAVYYEEIGERPEEKATLGQILSRLKDSWSTKFVQKNRTIIEYIGSIKIYGDKNAHAGDPESLSSIRSNTVALLEALCEVIEDWYDRPFDLMESFYWNVDDEYLKDVSLNEEAKVSRDSLFEELVSLVNEQKLVFLTGGVNSGRRTFQVQFEKYVTSKTEGCDRYSAQFRERFYDAGIKFLSNLREGGGEVHHQEVNSLLASLAFSAYRRIREGSSIEDRNELKKLIPGVPAESDFSEKLGKFMQNYFDSDFLLKSRRDYKCIEHFLKFVDKILDAVDGNKDDTQLTIFMPYEELSRFIQTGATGSGSNIVLQLFRSLEEFIVRYQDQDGRDRPSLKQVAFLVCLKTAPFGRTFSQRRVTDSIFVLRPLSDSEVRELVEQVLEVSSPDDNVLKLIKKVTGRAPWFVKMLLGCIQARRNYLSPQKPASDNLSEVDVKRATKDAKKIISEKPKNMPNNIRKEVDEYFEELENTLQGKKDREFDRKVIKRWEGRSSKGLNLYHDRLEDWLATGLIWLYDADTGKEGGTEVFSETGKVFIQEGGKLPIHLYNTYKKRNKASLDEALVD